MASNQWTGNTWVADSGASTHIGNVEEGMYDVTNIDEPVKVSNGNRLRCVKKGTLPLTAIQEDGNTVDIILKDYKYAPGFTVNLFSLTKAIDCGWQISNKGPILKLTKGKDTLYFDRIERTIDGVLCGVEMATRIKEPTSQDCAFNVQGESQEPESGGESNNSANSKSDSDSSDKKASDPKEKPSQYWNINKFHKIFGHASEEAMRATAKAYGWQLTGKFEACEDCQMSNVQQKAVPKTTETSSDTPGERLFVDMSSVSKHTSLGGARVWLCVVDDATGFVWNRMLKAKSEAPKKIQQMIRKLHDRKTPVKYVRLDNAGELRKLAKECEESKEQYLREVKFEFTGRDTPQRNGKVERKIAVMTRRVRSTLNSAKLSKAYRQKLWGECIMYLEDVCCRV